LKKSKILVISASILALVSISTAIVATTQADNEKTSLIDHLFGKSNYDRMPKEKQEMIDQDVQKVIDARNGHPSQSNRKVVYDKDARKFTLPKLGFDEPSSHVLPNDAVVASVYLHANKNLFYRLYSGQLDGSLTSGGIYVQTIDFTDPYAVKVVLDERFYPQERVQSLTIKSVTGLDVNLVDENGKSYVFNLETNTFE
jgi:hypothetical protein